jgi:hypothetical protein
MANFFFDDGGPDAEDYSDNYLYFDENKSECWKKIKEFVNAKTRLDSASREKLRFELAECAR